MDLDASPRTAQAAQPSTSDPSNPDGPKERVILRPTPVERMGFFEAIRFNFRRKFARR